MRRKRNIKRNLNQLEVGLLSLETSNNFTMSFQKGLEMNNNKSYEGGAAVAQIKEGAAKESVIALDSRIKKEINNSVIPLPGGILKERTANEWLSIAREKPVQRKLFGELWFENEICILFASSNVGKSILAVQIAHSLSTGFGVEPLQMLTTPSKVLYFDFELSDTQFRNRYSERGNDFEFNDNLLRVEVEYNQEIPDSLEKALAKEIPETIERTGAKIIVIDNLSFIKSETEKGKEAKEIINALKKLKNKLGLSILILAHTPKRDQSKPITSNDLSGSSVISNFIDSSFAINRSSQDPNLRYIKQIKMRNCGHIYNEDNVLVYEVGKKDCFTGLSFREFGVEQEHLSAVSKQEKEDKKQRAVLLRSEGKTHRAIASIIGVGKSTVGRWLEEAE